MSRYVTIRERATTCVDLFSQAILLLAQTESSEDHNSLLDEFSRFKLWTSNIGVFADLHSSLDYRLRDFNDIKDSFTRQLITVESRLQQLLDATQQDLANSSIKEDEDEDPGISTPITSTTAAIFQDWNNTQLLQSIHQSIDWLHRLSNLVRKASFANQHKRADKFILKDEDDNDMSDTLTDYYTRLIKREFSGLQDNLVQRLAASMLMRRRRIMYRRSQQQRWKIPQVEPKTKNLELASTTLIPTSSEPNVLLKNEKVLVSKPEGITTAPSRLTATTIDTNIRRRVSAPSGISKGSTAPLNEQSQLLIPPPPKGANFGEDFVCDYCCLILPSKIALNRNTWADHVSKDLYPYVCVADKCDDPIEIYSSRKEWLAHMKFDSENGFIEHMKIGHPGKFRNDQLSLVAENSSRPKDSVFDDCPFCIGTPDTLEEHVSLHLRDLALRSLPWPDDDECDSQRGEYLHSDNSISNENTRSTIVDFISKSAKSSIMGIIDDDDGFGLTAGEWLSPRSYFYDSASLYDSPRLQEQLSDKILIRLAIKQYRGVTELSTLVDKLETLLNDEYSQSENAAHLEEAFIIIQQLTKENSLDQEDSDDQSDKPYAITEELLRVSSQLPNVRWDSIDMGNLTLSASLKGPWGKDGADIFIKIKIDIPKEYPELKAPKFVIEKSPSIPEETHKRLHQELYELAEQFAQKKQNCLGKIFTYLLGEVDFESATPFSKTNRDLSDDSSTEEDDDILVGGSASMSQELPPADSDPDEPVSSVSTQIPRKSFRFAIICTLLIEYDAVCLIFDELWDKYSEWIERNEIVHTTGRIGRHNVVVALLTSTEKLTVVTGIMQSRLLYSQLKLYLLVGICGAVPKFGHGEREKNISLGDVILSTIGVKYGIGSNEKFIGKSTMHTAPKYYHYGAQQALYPVPELGSPEIAPLPGLYQFLFELQSNEIKTLDEFKPKYHYPGALKDRLFEAHYIHKHRITANDCSVCNGNPDAVCDNVLHCSICNGESDAVCSDACKASCQEIGCEEWQLVNRKIVPGSQAFKIYFGRIASADIVVTNGLERDKVSSQERVIGFDVNGFGDWENLPCIFIKGVCDYADGHKDDSWQNYAAATAAAAAKAFLAGIDP
ncbi:hypothetical protein THAR02_08748 [Trichoderma harzianum]|uniref:RWD domain-containing protein n=1 Tax=Trichoderma harzianum TaxID=5544 RepID=A0A0F9ZFL4_TRIHA|nr:hypothetical protein THAR02_08748 [Trichoderma harzianum]